MINFNNYFHDNYQFSLKALSYKNIENEAPVESLSLTITDTIETKVNGQKLNVVFGRLLKFEPEALYTMYVEFEFNLSFKEGIDPQTTNIEWSKELAETENPYISNVASRISLLISTITASYGQQPIITPPLPIFENN